MKEAMTLASFALTLFVSASIMFAIQPMAGKLLLPIVGGTPAGWIVALAFFQIMLLLGYLIAHLLSRFTPYLHGVFFILFLLACAVFLPVSILPKISTTGAWGIFMLLCLSIGPPFVALSMTSSTIQRLFTVTSHPSANDPYFLYRSSNLGSFAGLLLYPLLAEPRLTIDEQAQAVSLGYAALIVLACCCLAIARIASNDSLREKPASQSGMSASAWDTRLRWLALAFVPSSLLMGVTTYITTDVISAPMVWVLPLAIYLLTFVIAFSKNPLISLAAAYRLQPYAISAAVLFITMMQVTWLGGWMGVAFYLLVFGAVAQACHLQLVSLRPLGNERRLTEFYLMMSAGGALGGVLNAFIAPNVLDRLLEFPIVLLASFMLHPAFTIKTPGGKAFAGLLALSAALACAPAFGVTYPDARLIFSSVCVLVLAFVAPIFFRRVFEPLPLTLCMLTIFMVSQFVIADERYMVSLRNFYGTIKVYDSAVAADIDKNHTVRTMRHGSTIHGTQVRDLLLQMEPTAYYSRQGPLGDIVGTFAPKKVAAIGLGAGAVNCYYSPGRSFTYFELDPDVVTIAQKYFSFLSNCRSAKDPVIHTGDGRLELAKLKDEKFDLIVLDAFTSDAIPTHLLTREAFQLYFDHLEEGGVLALHISNRYFMLWDVIAATAASLDFSARLNRFDVSDLPFYASPSLWMVVAKQKRIDKLDASRWKTLAPSPSIRAWSDNYSSLLDTLVFTQALGGLK